MAKKSYWQGMHLGNESAKDACKSWFMGMADGLTPYKAEVLYDIETDREKKIRAFLVDGDGKKHQFERTLGGKTFSITMKPVKS